MNLLFPADKRQNCDLRRIIMELLVKAKDICVEYNGRDVLAINELELYVYDGIRVILIAWSVDEFERKCQICR